MARSRILFPLLGAMLLALLAPASATIGIVPIRMTLDARAPLSVFTITNKDDVAKVVKASLFRWEHQGVTDKLSPSAEVLISPPVFTIPPHETQVIRAFARKRAGATEQTYRMLVEDSPIGPSSRVGMGVTMHISVPIFVAPSIDSEKKAIWTVRTAPGSRYIVTLDNASNRHIRVVSIAIDEGKAVLGAVKDPSYVFAGERMEWTIVSLARPALKSVTLDVQADGGDFKQTMAVTQ